MVRDLRKYASQTNVRLITGGILLLFIIGDGLIYVIYGQYAALMGFVCLLAGLAPLLLIWFAMSLLEWLVRQANKE
jgi:hypothetical protein